MTDIERNAARAREAEEATLATLGEHAVARKEIQTTLRAIRERQEATEKAKFEIAQLENETARIELECIDKEVSQRLTRILVIELECL